MRSHPVLTILIATTCIMYMNVLLVMMSVSETLVPITSDTHQLADDHTELLIPTPLSTFASISKNHTKNVQQHEQVHQNKLILLSRNQTPCALHRPPEDLSDTQKFQEIPGMGYVFSSYYDTRQGKNEIKTLGLFYNSVETPKLCQVWLRDQSEPEYRELRSFRIPEYHDSL